MKILYVASEALPYASTGGLADVLGSLPIAVKRSLGDEGDVRVVIPMYPSVKEKFFDQMKFECETTVRLSWRSQYCGIWSTVREGVTYYFIDNEYYFKRPALYGSFDDGERFAFFGKAVLELMSTMQFFPEWFIFQIPPKREAFIQKRNFVISARSAKSVASRCFLTGQDLDMHLRLTKTISHFAITQTSVTFSILAEQSAEHFSARRL